MSLPDRIIVWGLAAIVLALALNGLAAWLWPRRLPPDAMAEPHGDVPYPSHDRTGDTP